MTNTRLYLIRHGITEWNMQKRYCGHKDIDLSSKGRAQAIKLRKSIKKISFDKIYCSDRKRALQTRAILFGKAKFLKVRDLREIHFGLLEGLTHDQLIKKYPGAYRTWLKDPYKKRIPQAESMQDFKKRVVRAMNKIVQSNLGKTVAVVCHGGVIAMFVSSILESKKFWKFVVLPVSVTTVDYKNRKFKILKFNEKM